MTEREQIISLKKEAEIYHSQGLLMQSKEKYMALKGLISKSDKYSENRALNRYLKDRINLVDIELEDINEEMDSPLLDSETQELISDLFSFSDNNEMATIESAVALAKFGQYEKALEEFNDLLEAGCFPLISAKNILRCHVALFSPEKAVSQYKKWDSAKRFTGLELLELKDFLSSILGRNSGLLHNREDMEKEDDDCSYKDNLFDFMEVCSIRLFMKNGHESIKKVEMNITCQEENIISFILNKEQKKIADILLPGASISKVQCFSKGSVFYTRAIVLKKLRITSGPQRGCYSYDLLLENSFYDPEIIRH